MICKPSNSTKRYLAPHFLGLTFYVVTYTRERPNVRHDPCNNNYTGEPNSFFLFSKFSIFWHLLLNFGSSDYASGPVYFCHYFINCCFCSDIVKQTDCAAVVINILSEYESIHGDGGANVGILSRWQFDEVVERYARLALNFDLIPSGNQPGYFLPRLFFFIYCFCCC